MADQSPREEPQLKVERDGSVVVLTMNNPRRRNALTPTMITLMAQAWDEIDADDGIRVAILTGEGSSYCVGGDLADGWMTRGPKTEDKAVPTGETNSVRSLIPLASRPTAPWRSGMPRHR